MSSLIKGNIGTAIVQFICTVAAGIFLVWITGFLSLPTKVALLTEKIENLKEINNKQANSLTSIKNELTEISNTVHFILGKIGDQKGVNSKKLIAASNAKGNSNSKSLKILQNVISQRLSSRKPRQIRTFSENRFSIC